MVRRLRSLPYYHLSRPAELPAFGLKLQEFEDFHGLQDLSGQK